MLAAIETEAEKSCWKFVEEENPGFEFNIMLSSVNFGVRLHGPPYQGSRVGDLEAANMVGLAPRSVMIPFLCMIVHHTNFRLVLSH